MEIHSDILTWKIPWTKEPGGLQFTGLQGSDTTEHGTHNVVWGHHIPAMSLVRILLRAPSLHLCSLTDPLLL